MKPKPRPGDRILCRAGTPGSKPLFDPDHTPDVFVVHTPEGKQLLVIVEGETCQLKPIQTAARS